MFSSENSGIGPKSRASFTGLELVKIFQLKIKLCRWNKIIIIAIIANNLLPMQ